MTHYIHTASKVQLARSQHVTDSTVRHRVRQDGIGQAPGAAHPPSCRRLGVKPLPQKGRCSEANSSETRPERHRRVCRPAAHGRSQ